MFAHYFASKKTKFVLSRQGTQREALELLSFTL
ncbi:hypothetical protein PM398_gp47 [Pseudomonas phage Epa40]|uniref:Uncharacterized protein n=1 Tax=Pseudomonas phage Epa40 TaxID=2719198 RepID=A0A6G9LM31_9CAUD|nr:hypothetical protein PM398_gp47 [Pseudomonas phage Epa40]QIQ66051.1 hypothetical protein 40_00047 [Pseudomonas phage Epa40]QIQ66103.1 hypothetical protein 41_00051 [Pseudomonas phage Epa41]